MLDPLTNVRSNGNGYQECQILHFSSYSAQIVILEPQTPKKHPTSGFLYLKKLHNCYSKTLLLELTFRSSYLEVRSNGTMGTKSVEVYINFSIFRLKKLRTNCYFRTSNTKKHLTIGFLY